MVKKKKIVKQKVVSKKESIEQKKAIESKIVNRLFLRNVKGSSAQVSSNIFSSKKIKHHTSHKPKIMKKVVGVKEKPKPKIKVQHHKHHAKSVVEVKHVHHKHAKHETPNPIHHAKTKAQITKPEVVHAHKHAHHVHAVNKDVKENVQTHHTKQVHHHKHPAKHRNDTEEMIKQRDDLKIKSIVKEMQEIEHKMEAIDESEAGTLEQKPASSARSVLEMTEKNYDVEDRPQTSYTDEENLEVENMTKKNNAKVSKEKNVEEKVEVGGDYQVKASKPIAQIKQGDKIKIDGKEYSVDAHYVMLDHGTTKEMLIEIFDPKTDKDYQLRYFDDQFESTLDLYELYEIMYVKIGFKNIEW